MRFWVYESPSVDPYYNLAAEEYLLSSAEDAIILYLWQNENTVVIGKNQNPWKECKVALLNQEGGRLARRLSGGGAVYHDLGNLNFTFLMPQSAYDLDRQLRVIQTAVGSFGIPTERSGRNDVLAMGRKFSGNAFYKNGKQAYHHGTLLVNVDQEKLSRYLNPSKAKLQSKGVDSVRSRVVNLTELCPDITIPKLKMALKEAFSSIYGAPLMLEITDFTPIHALAERNRSWEWNFGRRIPFAAEYEARFSWGEVRLELQVKSGIIQDGKVWTDAMDVSVAPQLEQALLGCRLDRESLCSRLSDLDIAGDILNLLLPDE